jgi:hypothetical protein
MPSSSSKLLVPCGVLLAVATWSCASNNHQVTLRRDLAGSKYARQTGYFAACGTSCAYEETPGQVRHDSIIDEATLTGLSSNETCVDVVVRTHANDDEPLEQLSPTMSVDGQSQRAVVESEVVTVIDLPYNGSAQVLRAESVVANSFSSLSIERPATLVFRVIQRTGRLCSPTGVRNAVNVTLHNPHVDFGASKGLLAFAWQLT